MDFKKILGESFLDGVNSFFDSALEQIEEDNKKKLEERLNRHEKMLEVVQLLLEDIGANGKFDKELKNKEDIWETALYDAIILSGTDIEDTEFADVKDYDVSLKDLAIQWQETVSDLDTIMEESRNENMPLFFLASDT